MTAESQPRYLRTGVQESVRATRPMKVTLWMEDSDKLVSIAILDRVVYAPLFSALSASDFRNDAEMDRKSDPASCRY